MSELIQNGNFTNGTTNWNVLQPANVSVFTDSSGNNWLRITKTSNLVTPVVSVISQTFPTIAGSSYRLSFNVFGNESNTLASNRIAIQSFITDNDSPVTSNTYTVPTTMEPLTGDFVATTSSTTLTFAANNNHQNSNGNTAINYNMIYIDNVSVKLVSSGTTGPTGSTGSTGAIGPTGSTGDTNQQTSNQQTTNQQPTSQQTTNESSIATQPFSRFGRGSNSYGNFWYGNSTNFPGFLYKKNVGVAGRRSTKMNPGGNVTCNSSTYIYNKYKPGTGGIGASSTSNRRAKNRGATVCTNNGTPNCGSFYQYLGRYDNYTGNPNGYFPYPPPLSPQNN